MLIGLSLQQIAVFMLLGVLLDYLFAELPRWHPLVGFGNCTQWLEKRLNHGGFWQGVLGWCLLVLPPVALVYACLQYLPDWGAALLNAVLLYFCLGLCSLKQHTQVIYQALQAGDLPKARQLTSRIVSRDTSQASASDLSKAAVESLLENGNDAVFGTLFWFILAGAPGVLLFRLANTLDAMWGYRNPRFLHFGCFAARVDDVLNFIPARLTALSYLLFAPGMAGKKQVWACWQQQSPAWPSPNAGPVMSSGAASLGLALGGYAVYDGVAEQRPPLGQGRAAQAEDIALAWRLVWRCVWLWMLVVALFALIFA